MVSKRQGGKGNGADGAPPSDGAAGGAGELDIAAELDKLPPEQVEMFIRALSLAMKKRRVMLVGYLAAMLSVLLGQIFALMIWADREPGTFIGWIFLVPLAAAGLILVGTARVVRRLKPPAP